MTPTEKTNPNANPVYQKIVDKLLAIIERGTNPWTHGFIKANDQAPRNAHTGYEYNGINYLMLSLIAWLEGWPENLWLTYLDAKKLGGYIEKGQKSKAEVIFYKLINKRTPAEDNELEGLKASRQYNSRYYELIKKQYMMARYTPVFNISQTTGIDQDRLLKHKPEPPKTYGHTPIEAAEHIAANMPNPPKITFGGNQPAYRPTLDEIYMVPLERYEQPERYYKTLFHEQGHATGHASRLDRPGISEFNGRKSHSYSYEELIAELTAANLAAVANITTDETEENSAAYLKGWIKPLNDDPKMIVKAASEAAKATDYILGLDVEPTPPTQADSQGN